MRNAISVINDVEYATDAASCLNGPDAKVLATDWDQSRALEPVQIKGAPQTANGCRLTSCVPARDMQTAGAQYVCIWRSSREHVRPEFLE